MGTQIYEFVFHRVAESLGECDRQGLLRIFDGISNQVWRKNPKQFRGGSATSFFSRDDGVVIVRTGAKIVGFSTYRRLQILGRHLLFRNLTCISPGFQRHGLYGRLFDLIIGSEQQSLGVKDLFFCWRTRNPVVWFAHARRSARLMPDIEGMTRDLELTTMASLTASILYPQDQFDPSTFRMAYKPAEFIVTPHLADTRRDQRFYSHPAIRDPDSCLFGIGQLPAQSDV